MPVLYVPSREHVFIGTCNELATISGLLAHRSECWSSPTEGCDRNGKGGTFQVSTKAECKLSGVQGRGSNHCHGHSQDQHACPQPWEYSCCSRPVETASPNSVGVRRLDQLDGQAGTKGTSFFRICTREEEEEALSHPSETPNDWSGKGDTEDVFRRQAPTCLEDRETTKRGEGNRQKEDDELHTKGQVVIPPEEGGTSPSARATKSGKGRGNKIQAEGEQFQSKEGCFHPEAAKMLEEPHNGIPNSSIEQASQIGEARCTNSEPVAPQKGEGKSELVAPQKGEGSTVGPCMHANQPDTLPTCLVFAFNSNESDADATDASDVSNNEMSMANSGKHERAHILGHGEEPITLLPDPNPSASLLLTLAGLAFVHFPSGILNDYIKADLGSDVDAMYISLKYSSSEQWLCFFQKQTYEKQVNMFHSPGLQALLLTRACRADGLS